MSGPSSSIHDKRSDRALAAILFAAFAALYFFLALDFSTIAGYRIHDNIFFGSDHVDALKGWTGNHKGSHPLLLLVVVPFGSLLGWLLGSTETGLLVQAALIGGGSVAAFFGLCRLILERRFSLLLALLYGVGMNQLVFAPLPDTYVLAGMSVIPGYALLARKLAGGRPHFGWWVLAGIASFAITITCFSQTVICYAVCLWQPRDWWAAARRLALFVVAVLGAAAALSLVQAAIFPDAQLFFRPSSLEYEMQYVSDDALSDPVDLGVELTKTLALYTVVGQAPRVDRIERGEWVELVYAWTPLELGWRNLMVGACWLLLFFRGLWLGFRDPSGRPLRLAAAAAVLTNAVLHTFFNPDELFLYTSFFWAPMLLLMASGANFQGRVARVAWVALPLLVALHNLAVIRAYVDEYRGHPRSVLVARDAHWRYFRGTADPPANWMAQDFDDSQWSVGRSGFGYGDRDDATRLPDMPEAYSTLFLRHTFELADPAAVEGVLVDVAYDDGFVLYLNGQRRLSENAPEVVDRTSVALADHEADEISRYRLSSEMLQPGRNTLAAVGLNRALDSSDFSLRIQVLRVDRAR